jgi:hypothetical protein
MDTEHKAVVVGRHLGGDSPEAGLEEVANDVFGTDFLEANGLGVLEDEAELEDPHCSQLGRWSDQRLDISVHAYTEVTVRELVYTVMKVSAGSVKATQMDEMIKTFKRALPDGNDMPGYEVILHPSLSHNSAYLSLSKTSLPHSSSFSYCCDRRTRRLGNTSLLRMLAITAHPF